MNLKRISIIALMLSSTLLWYIPSFSYALQNSSSIVTIPLNGDVTKSQELTISFIESLPFKELVVRQQENDQFFTYNIEKLTKVLQPLSLESYTILEIGSGTGIISNAILKKNVTKLIVTEIDSRIHYDVSENVQVFHDDFRNFKFSEISKQNLGLIANPPYNLLSEVRDFIDQQNIKNVILIIPAWRYLELFPDYTIVGALDNSDFKPKAESNNEVHLIIKKGFSITNIKDIPINKLLIGREIMDLNKFVTIARKKFKLDEHIWLQAGEHLGGKIFESLDTAIELLRYKTSKQQGGIVYSIQHAEWEKQKTLININKHKLSIDEVTLLEGSLLESKISYAAELAITQLLLNEKVILGQRTEIHSLISKGYFQEHEVLSIPSELWNWHINRLWIKTGITLQKKFVVVVAEADELHNLISRVTSGKDLLDTGRNENNKYLYHSMFNRPTYLGLELSMLIDAGYNFNIKKALGHIIIEAECSNKHDSY